MTTPIFITGAEAGVIEVGASGLTPLWNTVGGAAYISVSTTIFHNGLRAYRFNPTANAAAYLSRNIATTVLLGTLAIRFDTLPNGDTTLIRMTNAQGSPTIHYEKATKQIAALIAAGTKQYYTPTIETGVWYIIDVYANTSGDTATIDWRVNGIAQIQATNDQTAANMTAFIIGSTSSRITDIYMDDIVISVTSGDYPIGEVKVLGYSPNVSGDHSFTAGDFQDSTNGNIALPAGDVHSLIDELPITNGADYVKQVVARAAGYVRFGFADTEETDNAIGVEVVSSQHSANTQANNAAFNLDDGGTLGTIYALKDISQTSLIYNSTCFATRPNAGGAWTQAAINALAARWGYATDVSPNPYVDGVILEIAWLAAAPPELPYPNQFNKILYTSEPPTPNAWNQVKQEAGTGWRKLEYS